MNEKVEQVSSALAGLITEWNSLNQAGKNGFVYDALKAFDTKGFYELPSDITISGNKYFLEPYEVGMERIGSWWYWNR